MNDMTQGGRLDDDPTGVRDLLAGLPEPGPMPEDLVRRISASLAEEQAVRASRNVVRLGEDQGAGTGSDGSSDQTRPIALGDRFTAPARTVAGQGSTPTARGVDELAARRQRRNRFVTAVAGVAAAGALLLGGGYLATRPQAGEVTATPDSKTYTGSEKKTPVGENVQVIASGHDYEASTFANDASALKAGALTTDETAMSERQDAQQARSNPTSLAPCVKGLAGDLLAQPETVTVDFAKYQGQDAIIVVMQRDGKSTAWAVGSSCTVNDTAVMAGPEPVEG